MKIYLKIFFIIITAVIIGCLFFYFADIVLSPASLQKFQNQVCFDSHCFSVELAKTNAEKERGLMFRSDLKENKGMLFIFDEESIYPFYMKNTLIPLDIIWINKDKKVVFISKNAQPCEQNPCPITTPTAGASYVLEVNAGKVEELEIKTGDSVKLIVDNSFL